MSLQRKKSFGFVLCQTISILCSAIATVFALHYVKWFFYNAIFATPYQIGRAACSVIVPIGIIAFLNHFLSIKNEWRKFWIKKPVVFLFVYYVLIALCFLFFGGRSEYDYSHAVPNFTLFSRIRLRYEIQSLPFAFSEIIVEYIKNIALFFPFGAVAPLIFHRLRRVFPFLCASLIIILLVEALQQLSHVGFFDIDDCFFNFIGSLCGYLSYKVSDIVFLKLIRHRQIA